MARIVPKERWLDPPVVTNGTVQRMSVLNGKKKRSRRAV